MARIHLIAMVDGVVAGCDLVVPNLRWTPHKPGDDVTSVVPSKLLDIIIADDSGTFRWVQNKKEPGED